MSDLPFVSSGNVSLVVEYGGPQQGTVSPSNTYDSPVMLNGHCLKSFPSLQTYKFIDHHCILDIIFKQLMPAVSLIHCSIIISAGFMIRKGTISSWDMKAEAWQPWILGVFMK